MREDETDYYQFLNVSKKATAKEIHRAYLKKAKKIHPDVCQKPVCKELFQSLLVAYQTLKDPEKRKKYDQELVVNLFRHHVSEPARKRFTKFSGLSGDHGDDDWSWRVG